MAETAPGKKRGGRKPKLTPEILAEVEKLAAVGLTDKAIAEYIGVKPETFSRWKKKSQFNQALQKARAKKKAWLLEKIREAGEKAWQAYAWMLERMAPDEYGMRMRHEGFDGGPVKHEHGAAPDLDRRIDEILEKTVVIYDKD